LEAGDLTPDELYEHLHYAEIEADIEDQRFGSVCALLANAHRDREERPDPFLPTDFFRLRSAPDVEPEEPEDETPAAAAIWNDFWVGVKTRTKQDKAKRAKRSAR